MDDFDKVTVSQFAGRLVPALALPTAAPQQSATISLQRALATGVTAEQLRAVASWNDRKSYDERRRKARSRHKAQAVALRAVAEDLECLRGVYEAAREAA